MTTTSDNPREMVVSKLGGLLGLTEGSIDWRVLERRVQVLCAGGLPPACVEAVGREIIDDLGGRGFSPPLHLSDGWFHTKMRGMEVPDGCWGAVVFAQRADRPGVWHLVDTMVDHVKNAGHDLRGDDERPALVAELRSCVEAMARAKAAGMSVLLNERLDDRGRRRFAPAAVPAGPVEVVEL